MLQLVLEKELETVHYYLLASLVNSHVWFGLFNAIVQEEWLEFEDPSSVET